MDLIHGEGVSELFQVQCHLYKHIFSYIDSMSLKCAIQLGILDTIHNHGHPITLQELVSKLHIHPKKLAACMGLWVYWFTLASSLKH